jgi:2-phospho-L-lactate guanylyltransferase
MPLKPLSSAKSRLAPLPPPLRSSLALAMAADTAAAALASPLVSEVFVVCDDEAARSTLEAVGCRFLPDEHHGDLNAALASAAARAGGALPRAALTADLPALHASHVTQALSAAGHFPHVHVQDAAGTGTTLLTARGGLELAPRYGHDSCRRHRAGGSVALSDAAPALRQDVDTLADLAVAVHLGVGPCTTAVLRSSSARGAGLHHLPLCGREVPVPALYGIDA